MSDSRFQSPRMPEAYAAKMRAARRTRAMRGERRIITMLFCDVAGSTAMAAQLDAEEWAEIMNEAFEYLITPVYRYEGTVARLLGDAILAFFGAPIAHEDDPQRAVMAGLDIVEGVRAFREEIRQDYGLDFNVRVGINTGPVVVGEVGTDLALEYTAMGDAINLAARMESTAEPGAVQITANTYKLVAPLFDVRDLGKIAVKGKEEAVQAYRVLGKQTHPGRLRGIQGLNSQLIGRAHEFEILSQTIAACRQGQGQIICLIGEAGLGKSRLIDELRAAWNEDLQQGELRWITGRGVSYDSTRPYGVIQQMLRQVTGVAQNDPPQVVRQKIRQQLGFFPPAVQENMAYALEMLLLLEAETDQPGPQGEALKRELFAAFLETWRGAARDRPLVGVFDDLHWADAASVELLQHLFQLAETVPALFLCSFRPDHESPGWQVKEMAAEAYPARYTEINLQPLTNEDTIALVDSLLTISQLPQALYERILLKADGNPFFVEEVVRALIDNGALVQDETGLRWLATADVAQIDIPDSVQALLIARIDRLEKEAKQTLQLASVIGRSFYERVLKNISETTVALNDHLQKLEQVDLIHKTAHFPELEYAFRHALTRDAAYKSILRRQRRRFHRGVGEALELLFPNTLQEEAHRLAYHFYEARDFERALNYYTMAADKASGLYANTEAIDHYGRALEIARDKGTDEQLIYLYAKRGRTFEVGGRYDEAMANYQELMALAQERDDTTLLVEALLSEATLYSTYTDQFDPGQGRALLQQALELAQSSGNRQAEAKIYWNLMLQGTYSKEEPAKIVAYGEKAVAIARQNNLREELAYALHDLARPYTVVGRMQDAKSVLKEAAKLWRELKNMPMLADNLATLGSGYAYQGSLDEAFELVQEAFHISRSIGNYWGQAYSLAILAPIFMERGQVDDALQAWQDAIPVAAQANFTGPQVFARINLSLAHGYLGDIKQGMIYADLALAKAIELEQTRIQFLPVLAQAMLHLYDGDVTAAKTALLEPISETDLFKANINAYSLYISIKSQVGLVEGKFGQTLALLDRAIAATKGMDLLVLLLELWPLKAQALMGLDRLDEAESVLNEARTTALSIGSQKQLWRILDLMAQLENTRGNTAAARALRQEAQACIQFIASHISQPDLRRTFLNSLPVVSISAQSA